MIKTNKTLNKTHITPEEKQVLQLLQTQGKCVYGNIFKQLKMNHSKGIEVIYSLTNKGYIKNIGRSSYYDIVIKRQ